MNDSTINDMLSKMQHLSPTDFSGLHKGVLEKFDIMRTQHGLKPSSSPALIWLRQAVNSIRSLKRTNPKHSFLLSAKSDSSKQKHTIITARQFKRTGEMFLFEYQPSSKNRTKIAHWDQFPMVMIVEIHDDGFSGINLHYLPIRLRVQLFLMLMKLLTFRETIRGEDQFRSRSTIPRLRISYDILNKNNRYRFFRPAYKRYKYNKIRSKMLLIEPVYWDIAMFLPIDRFKKEQRSSVWAKSIQTIQEHNRPKQS